MWRIATGNGKAVQIAGANETVLAVTATVEGEVAAGFFGSGLWLAHDARREPDVIEWQRPQVALHSPPVVTPVGNDLLALDADGFLARSQDGGAQWSEGAITSPDNLFALAGTTIDGEDGTRASILFAATASGISRWHNTQEVWQPTASEPFLDHTALGVDLSPAFGKDQTILVGTHDSALLLSSDGGITWHQITTPWQNQSLLYARFAPDNASEIVALSVLPTEAGHFAVTVWHTVDLGQQWEVLAGFSSGVPAVLLAWPQDTVEHALFLAVQHRVVKLYNQIDPPTLQVHQHFFDETVRVTALSSAPDYADSNIIWAATTAGLYRSVDRGMSWGFMLEAPLGLPVVWLEVTLTHVHAITLGGRTWRTALVQP